MQPRPAGLVATAGRGRACRRIWRSVRTSMAGSRCTPTQTPLTKIFVAWPRNAALQSAAASPCQCIVSACQHASAGQWSHGQGRRASAAAGPTGSRPVGPPSGKPGLARRAIGSTLPYSTLTLPRRACGMTLAAISSRLSVAHSSRNSSTGADAQPTEMYDISARFFTSPHAWPSGVSAGQIMPHCARAAAVGAPRLGTRVTHAQARAHLERTL